MSEPGPLDFEREKAKVKEEITRKLHVFTDPAWHYKEGEPIPKNSHGHNELKFLINPDFSLNLTTDDYFGHAMLARVRSSQFASEPLLGSVIKRKGRLSIHLEHAHRPLDYFGFDGEGLPSEVFYEILEECILEKIRPYFAKKN